jgi:hypothetical protein
MMKLSSLMLLLPIVLGIECGTDNDFLNKYPIQDKRHTNNKRSLQSGIVRGDSIETIRFHLEYSLTDPPEIQQRLKTRLESFAIPWFQRLLKVHPVQGTLKLADNFFCGSVEISDFIREVGVPADIIIFVTSNSYPGQTFAARAAPCVVDNPPFENVIAGFLEVNSFYYPGLSEEDELQLFPHEMTHILGFSRSLFDYYHKGPDVLYDVDEITLSSFARGAPVWQIVLPQVAQAGRDEFNCSTLTGVEVEGTTEDIGSHWDKRVLFNEYMISDITVKEVSFSKITAALLNSTGWYFVDFTYTYSIGQGAKEGCSYLDDPCLVAEEPLFEYYCNHPETEVCAPTHLHVGSCNVGESSSPVPLFYQWYENPDLGGFDIYNDFCPYVRPIDNRNCRGRELQPTLVNPELYGDEACTDCRCVEGSYINSTAGAQPSSHATCHRVLKCDLLAHEVTLQVGEVEVVCSFVGGEISIPGYTGTMKCPPSDILCRPQACIQSCNGVGLCINGICKCDPGYSGDNCRTICTAGCKHCAEFQPEVCTDCIDNASLNGTSCSCNQGFNLTDGQCKANSACDEGLKYLDGLCVESCPPETTVEVQGVCTHCSQNCLTCAHLPERCTSCSEEQWLNGNECVDECPFGTFANETSCQTCSQDCLACAYNADLCTMCQPPLVLSEGKCRSVCPRLVSVQIGSICYPCSSLCEACEGSVDNCISCGQGAIVFNGTCVTQCPEFYARVNDTCLRCDFPCTRCEADLSTCI